MKKYLFYTLLAGILLSGLFLAFQVSPASAATITAPTCNQPDVQNAINQAVDGDTVQIPAGTCTWTSIAVISKAITLTGSGTMPSVGAATSGGTRIT